MPNPPKEIVDPSPSKYRSQALLVAIVLIVVGIIVFFIFSAIAGGVVALLGAVFGLGSQVAKSASLE